MIRKYSSPLFGFINLNTIATRQGSKLLDETNYKNITTYKFTEKIDEFGLNETSKKLIKKLRKISYKSKSWKQKYQHMGPDLKAVVDASVDNIVDSETTIKEIEKQSNKTFSNFKKIMAEKSTEKVNVNTESLNEEQLNENITESYGVQADYDDDNSSSSDDDIEINTLSGMDMFNQSQQLDES